ncbi:MAG: triose-phosphate isomerase [Pseudomonadota bacterium]
MPNQKRIAGNWKMNGLTGEAIALTDGLLKANETGLFEKTRVLICPPYTALTLVADRVSQNHLLLGAQDCHAEERGAHTGSISAEMVRDAGCTHVILGHSERRGAGETSAEVREKVSAALRAGLTPLICVGEQEADRDTDKHIDVVNQQIEGSLPEDITADQFLLAYEPIWAIGTGRTASSDDILEMHKAIRENLNSRFGSEGDYVGVLYGGSVKPANARDILWLDNVDGVLVGGASLNAEDFIKIAEAGVEEA